MKHKLLGTLLLWLCTNALAVETTIIVSWSEVLEDIDGNPINEALDYELWADVGFGFNRVTVTPDLQYVYYNEDMRPGCIQVYLKACYADGGLCSPASSIEQACITADGEVDSGNEDGSSEDGGASGSAGGIPPRPPVFTISVQ